MSAAHILLTGGTGFFGRALLRTWLAQTRTGLAAPIVTVVSRAPERFLRRYPELGAQSWLRLHAGDVCDAASLPGDRSFTHILHAATDSTLGPEFSPLERYDQIVVGTRNLLDLAVQLGCPRFLLTSSGAVYGTQPIHLERLPEDWHGIPDPLRPESAYGIGKRAAEHLCALYGQAHNLEVVIARCFAFVGPDLPLDVHFAIGNFIRDALWRDEISVGGDGTALRSYLDQHDLAQWLIALLDSGRPGRAYNVGSDQAISVGDLAYLVRDIVAPEKPVRILGRTLDHGQRNVYVPSIDRARQELGLDVTIPLESAIDATARAAAQDCLGDNLRWK
jgi:UDP-glucuronate decarboxylase